MLLFDRYAANVEDGTRLPQAAHRNAALACGYHSLAAMLPAGNPPDSQSESQESSPGWSAARPRDSQRKTIKTRNAWSRESAADNR